MRFQLLAALGAAGVFTFAVCAQNAAVGIEDSASAAARLVHQTRPVYPPEAKAAHISGKVRLTAIINKDGKVEDLRIVSGHPLLAAAAYDTVLGWEYTPVEKDGQAVSFKTDIDLNFTLADNGVPPVEVPGSVQVGKLVNKVRPVYPPDAKQQGVQGTVRLRATIGKTGQVESIYVRDGDPALVASAVDAVQQWQYNPTLVGAESVPVVTDIDVNFVLQQ